MAADTVAVAVEATRVVVVVVILAEVAEEEVILAAVVVEEVILAVAALAAVAVDGQVVVLAAAEGGQCTVLLLECELLQVAETPVDYVRRVRLARHRSVNLIVRVNFAHRRELAILDRLDTMDQRDKFDRVVRKVLRGLERTRVLATNHEM